ncbi:hypothetical protein RRG08_031023 [Elysia crispata]|uniref:Cadherin domain-containing protein n=1 Tax=Elysia crispata TaxID=231223 RepID=A0AAE0ZF42_9GAST|nr:hypothetical protein RRG08_031023 [Elysia crispata]
MDNWFFGIVLLVCLKLSLQATDNGVPATLTMLAVDVELNETEHRRVQLTDGGGASTDPVLLCTPDAADNDPVRVYIQAASPTAPCGMNCFSLQPCGSSGEHCLFYLPGVDTLSVTLASRYTLTVGCTDDAEPGVTGTLTVTVISNTPPVFVPAAPLAVSLTIDGLASSPGAVIYEISTEDVDNDFVDYSMTLSPDSEYLFLLKNGQIKTAQDLRMFCGDRFTASITASDGYNSPIGPFTLGLTLDPHNEAPTVTNLDTTLSYREKPGVGYTVLELATADTTVFDTLNIHMWADSSAGMELYKLSGESGFTKMTVFRLSGESGFTKMTVFRLSGE